MPDADPLARAREEAERVLLAHFKHLQCPAPVDVLDPEDAAGMAAELARVLAATGLLRDPAAETWTEWANELPDGEMNPYYRHVSEQEAIEDAAEKGRRLFQRPVSAGPWRPVEDRGGTDG